MVAALSKGAGESPEGWRLVCLGDMASLRNEQMTPVEGDHRPYVALENIVSGGSLNGYSKAGNSVSNKTTFRKGDTLYGKLRPNLRKVVRVDFNGVCSTDILAVFPNNLMDGPFLSHLLQSYPLHEHAMRGVAGTKMPRTSWKHLREFKFVCPPLLEQRRIALVLDAIDEAIECTEAVITATERLRGALLHELLTRGVPGWHTEWKEALGLGTIPACWEVVRLGEVAEVERGKFAHRPRNEPRFYGGDVPFIQTADVVRANGRIRQHSQTLNDLGLSISRLFPAGTIIVTIAANIGETAIADYPVAFPDSLVGVTPHGINTIFLEYFLRTQRVRLNQFAPESAQKNINLEDLRPLSAPLPTVPEQQAIAELLDGVDRAIEGGREERDSLQSLKASAADALLTGRVRV